MAWIASSKICDSFEWMSVPKPLSPGGESVYQGDRFSVLADFGLIIPDPNIRVRKGGWETVSSKHRSEPSIR